MSKILVIPPKLEDIDSLIDIGIDGFILGLKDFSFFHSFELTIEQLKEIIPKIKKAKKEIFISLNKIIYNEDIPLLKEYLLILEKLDINGILYDDISIVNLKQELKLKTPLVWNQLHFPTNYHTCNYWYSHGVKYGMLSTAITLKEIITIKKKTKMKLMVNVYGYLPIFTSSRYLISNYFEYINKSKKDELYYIGEDSKDELYPIYEDKKGTYILSSHILNALDELPLLIKNKVDYLVLRGLSIESHDFINITKCFVEALDHLSSLSTIKKLSKKVADYSNKLTDKGFLYKETGYKVKSNE